MTPTASSGPVEEQQEAVSARLAAVEAERDALRKIAEEAVEEFADALPYAGDYFREKWGYDETLARLRRALSVVPGEREREEISDER